MMATTTNKILKIDDKTNDKNEEGQQASNGTFCYNNLSSKGIYVRLLAIILATDFRPKTGYV